MRRFYAAFALFLCSNVVGQGVVVEGKAMLSASPIESTRREALENALRTAALNAGVQLTSRSVLEKGELIGDRTEIALNGTFSSVEILDERISDGKLFLKVKAIATQRREGCLNDGAGGVTVTGVMFPILHPQQQRSDGLTGFATGIPDELLHRLSIGGFFRPVRRLQRTVFSPLEIDLAPLSLGVRSQVEEILETTNASYLLAGAVVDIGYERQDFLFFSQYRRRAEIVLYLYGKPANLILERRIGRITQGEVLFDPDVDFGSQRFYESDYGQAFNWVIDEAAAVIEERIRCGDKTQPTRPLL